MASNFNASEFFKSTYFAPIQVGQHKVTLGRIKTVVGTKDNGEDASYLLVPMAFTNGRVIDARFYGIGAKIFCDQLRKQLEDNTDYKSLPDYLKTLTSKEVDLWISQRTYASTDGTTKSTLQYDFVAPRETTETETTEEHPFG